MAKKIIVLDTSAADGGFITIRAAMWFTQSNPIAQPGADSAWPQRSQAEVDALRAGSIKEEVRGFRFPNGTSTVTMKAVLEAEQAARQVFYNSQPPPGQYYGVFFDNGVWSA